MWLNNPAYNFLLTGVPNIRVKPRFVLKFKVEKCIFQVLLRLPYWPILKAKYLQDEAVLFLC
jgi:hypothetical protein